MSKEGDVGQFGGFRKKVRMIGDSDKYAAAGVIRNVPGSNPGKNERVVFRLTERDSE
jgi:hypothetical protein